MYPPQIDNPWSTAERHFGSISSHADKSKSCSHLVEYGAAFADVHAGL